MAKRLILVMALLFVAAFAFSAYAEVQNVKVSGDITTIGAVRNLELTQREGRDVTTGQDTTHADSFLATITRITISADLTDNVSTVVRLLNERYWGKETDNENSTGGGWTDTNTTINLDLAYVTLKEFLYSPLTMTIGRQELHFGNDMIIGDPDTNNRVTSASPFGALNNAGNNRLNMDLTARKSFDAIRSTLNYDPVTVDLVAAQLKNNQTNEADDINLYGVNAGYDINKKLKVEGYLWSKQIERKTNTNLTGGIGDPTMTQNKRRYTNVVGSRVSGEPVEGLSYSLEGAMQWGKWNGNSVSPYFVDNALLAVTPDGMVSNGISTPTVDQQAWALEAFLNYDFKKVKYTPSIGAVYAYFSGDDMPYPGDTLGLYDNNKKYRGWDPMFENQTFGHVHNALFNQTNQHIIGFKGALKPFQDVTVKGEYYQYFLAKAPQDSWDNGVGPIVYNVQTVARPDQNIAVNNQRHLGQEIDLTLTYDYTEDVQFNLLGGVFLPGNVFSSGRVGAGVGGDPGRSNNAASEVIGSMKVTF